MKMRAVTTEEPLVFVAVIWKGKAEAEETTTDEILRGVLERIPVPAGY